MHYYTNLLQKQKKRFLKFSPQIAGFVLSAVNVHEPIMLLQGLYCTLASENKFYDFTCTFTVALVHLPSLLLLQCNS